MKHCPRVMIACVDTVQLRAGGLAIVPNKENEMRDKCQLCPHTDVHEGEVVHYKGKTICIYCYLQMTKAFVEKRRPRALRGHPVYNPHFVAITGLRKEPPHCKEAFHDIGLAAAYLATIHDLTTAEAVELQQWLYLELDAQRYGDDYCQIIPCTCRMPVHHCQSGVYEDITP